MELLARAQALELAGHHIVHMEVGEPDFQTPSPVRDAGIAAIEQGHTRYTPAGGDPELRVALAEFYTSRYRCQLDPQRVFITAGASGALMLCAALLVERGDNLLMTDPGYPCNRHFMLAVGGEGRLVPVCAANNYQISPAQLADAWDARTRGVLLASPANPTGAVMGAAELCAMVGEVDARGGVLVMDEIYHQLTYGDPPPTALSVTDRGFVIGSFSKYFGMTGWRLGWVVVPDDAVGHMEKLAQNFFICASSIAQRAALAAFTSESLEIMEAQRQTLRERRDFLVPALAEAGFEIARCPEGAFYVYARLPDGVSAEAFCERALTRHHVSITPGTDFGFKEAEQHVRVTFAQDTLMLREGVSRLREALREV